MQDLVSLRTEEPTLDDLGDSLTAVESLFEIASEDAADLERALETLVLELWERFPSRIDGRGQLLRSTAECALGLCEARSVAMQDSRRRLTAAREWVEHPVELDESTIRERMAVSPSGEPVYSLPRPRAPELPPGSEWADFVSPVLEHPEWQSAGHSRTRAIRSALEECLQVAKLANEVASSAGACWLVPTLRALDLDVVESRVELARISDCLKILVELLPERDDPELAAVRLADCEARLAAFDGRSVRTFPEPAVEPTAVEPTAPALCGQVSMFSLGETINLLHTGQHSGVLEVVAGECRATLLLVGGEVVRAECAEHEGADAYFSALGWRDASFEFRRLTDDVAALERNVHYETIGLLVEGARRLDEVRRGEGLEDEAVVDAGPRSRDLRSRLKDPLRLGTLRLCDRAMLERTSATPDHRTIALVGSLAQFVSRLLDLGLTLPPDDLACLLAGEERLLSLTFHGGDGCALEALLVDERRMGRALALLPPLAAIVVVPSAGDLLPLGVECCTQFLELLRAREPRLLLGVGGEDLGESLVRSCELVESRCGTQRLARGADGEVPALRSILRECLDRLEALGTTAPDSLETA